MLSCLEVRFQRQCEKEASVGELRKRLELEVPGT